MLNIMSFRPASSESAPSAAEIHYRIEAMKLAYSDLRRYDAEPLRHSPVSKRHSPILAGIPSAVALTSKLE